MPPFFTQGIQTTPFQHHVVLRSNEERESAINVFLPPLLSVRQRVRPSTVFSGRHVGWREGQPAVQACQKWERLPAPARQREWRGRSITQRMSLVTLAPQKLMNERREGRSLLAAKIPLGASLLLFLSSSLMQQKALALSW